MADADDNINYDNGLQNDPDDTNPIDDMKRKQELPEDNDTPFSEPRVQQSRLSETHQETDSNIDSDERYQEGLASAAEVDPQTPEDGIPDYNPDNILPKE